MLEQSINTDDLQDIVDLFGSFDENIKLLQREFNVNIINRGGNIKIFGEVDDVSNVKKIIEIMIYSLKNNETLDDKKMRYIISHVKNGKMNVVKNSFGECVFVTSKGRSIMTKTFSQKKYVKSIRENTITFGIGPAGTGKTYLAVALAAKAFRENKVDRIILTRPAIEAGENLGFLPGDLQSKVDPYLRPLYDALFDIIGTDSFNKNVDRGNIEIAPLAYMRGRTLDSSFIILDEAQNTTSEQMKMFLTRLGLGSKIVVTGDITQIDLPKNKRSGLVEVNKVLKGIDGIEFIEFKKEDVVRHRLVQDIVNAYDNYNVSCNNIVDRDFVGENWKGEN